MENILILNTGGTFNKVYNELNGHLEVVKNSDAIEKILKIALRDNLNITLKGILFKDSLELTDDDRQLILNEIQGFKKVIIVHGTDTLDVTALFLSLHSKNQTVVLTGAMRPFSIEPVEPTSNLSMAIQFLRDDKSEGVYIGMHGMVLEHHKLKKNRQIGKFELRNSAE